jgi:hypothetical protein
MAPARAVQNCTPLSCYGRSGITEFRLSLPLAIRNLSETSFVAIDFLMNQSAILPDFMPHADAGPQNLIRVSDGNDIVRSSKPHRAENSVAVGQKPGFVHGHRVRLWCSRSSTLILRNEELSSCSARRPVGLGGPIRSAGASGR